jgi:hypothetical protein
MKITQTKLIGNEKQNNEDLLARAINNPIIKEVLQNKKNQKEANEIDSLAGYIGKGVNLLKNIRDNFSVSDEYPSMIYSDISRKLIEPGINALYAINTLLVTGSKGLASIIDNSIEEKFGYYFEGLIKGGCSDQNSCYPFQNSLFAVEKLLLGQEDKAKDILHLIENDFVFDEDSGLLEDVLTVNTNHHDIIWAGNHLSYLLAKAISTSDTINYNPITSNFPRDEETLLIPTYRKGSYYQSGYNALWAVLNYLDEKFDVAKKIVESIEKKIGFDEQKWLIKDRFKKENEFSKKTVTTAENSLFLDLAYLTLAGKLDQYVKKWQ